MAPLSSILNHQIDSRMLIFFSFPAGDYPKPYGASDNSVIKALPSECIPSSGRRLYEWPILPAGYYNGGDPGADRVVVAATGEGTPAVSRVYCLTMTHRGATGNGFVPCIATTA